MRRLLLVTIVLFLLSAPALAAGPGARCEAVQLGRRTLARVDLFRFFDRELLRLIRLGLEGRIHITLTLMRRRTAWFDDVVLSVDRDVTLTWDDTRRRYLVDGVAIDVVDLEPLRLDRVALGRRDRDTAGTHYVEVSVRLQVVTVTSLLTAANWLTGGKSGPDRVSTSVARAVAEDLLRKASTSCGVVKGH